MGFNFGQDVIVSVTRAMRECLVNGILAGCTNKTITHTHINLLNLYQNYTHYKTNQILIDETKLQISLYKKNTLGYEDCDGKFTVEDFLFYESGPQRSLKSLTESPLLVLVSGLDQVQQKKKNVKLSLHCSINI